ncbi:hypothetical protein DSL72_008875 [Monilinia vaccinii-corymbosi]|uniref:Uncharacterized protein n=1 Tax=Monilinia vaccinii-corymbosi TaxID=61207 RepID=A0A8A3PSQ2_9HELO|nr:hypothetical protein DSL72_008875 [Monilinia vaccinii-corymbosi]
MEDNQSYVIEPGMPLLSSRQYPSNASMRSMLEYRDGPGDMLKLLLTIHERVLVAIIKNTIGHELASTKDQENDIRKCMYPINVQAGTYLITFLKRNSNNFLSLSKWRSVTSYIKSYIHFDGIPLEDDATPERLEEYKHAVEIEKLLCPGYTQAEIRANIKSGKISTGFINSDHFIKRLNDWYSHDTAQLVPTTYLTQSPCYVGCSNNISLRLAQDQVDDLENVNSKEVPCVNVFTACLKYAGIKFDRIEMVVLKVWDAPQFRKGETLITMLAGSLVCHGGLNAVQAGGQPRAITDVRTHDVCQEIFIRNNWTEENMDETKDLVKEHERQVQYIEDFDADALVTELETQVRDTGLKMETLEKELDDVTSLIQEKIKEAEEDLGSTRPQEFRQYPPRFPNSSSSMGGSKILNYAGTARNAGFNQGPVNGQSQNLSPQNSRSRPSISQSQLEMISRWLGCGSNRMFGFGPEKLNFGQILSSHMDYSIHGWKKEDDFLIPFFCVVLYHPRVYKITIGTRYNPSQFVLDFQHANKGLDSSFSFSIFWRDVDRGGDANLIFVHVSLKPKFYSDVREPYILADLACIMEFLNQYKKVLGNCKNTSGRNGRDPPTIDVAFKEYLKENVQLPHAKGFKFPTDFVVGEISGLGKPSGDLRLSGLCGPSIQPIRVEPSPPLPTIPTLAPVPLPPPLPPPTSPPQPTMSNAPVFQGAESGADPKIEQNADSCTTMSGSDLSRPLLTGISSEVQKVLHQRYCNLYTRVQLCEMMEKDLGIFTTDAGLDSSFVAAIQQFVDGKTLHFIRQYSSYFDAQFKNEELSKERIKHLEGLWVEKVARLKEASELDTFRKREKSMYALEEELNTLRAVEEVMIKEHDELVQLKDQRRYIEDMAGDLTTLRQRHECRRGIENTSSH